MIDNKQNVKDFLYENFMNLSENERKEVLFILYHFLTKYFVTPVLEVLSKYVK